MRTATSSLQAALVFCVTGRLFAAREVIKPVCTIAIRSLFLCGLFVSGPAMAQEIWYSSIDSEGSRLRNWPANDYLGLFAPGAKWRSSAAHIGVFVVTTQLALWAPAAELREIVSGLASRHIKLAMAGLMLHGHDGCGDGIEGYTGAGDTLIALRRLAEAGATVSAIAMDGPLYSGHVASGPHACHDSIDHVAAEVAERVRDAKTAFPDIEVGDIEPVGTKDGAWPDEIAKWMVAYKAATGMKLAFEQLDSDWASQSWEGQLLRVTAVSRAEGVKLGVIYNGGGRAGDNDLAWTHAAERRFRYIEGAMGFVPDIAAIASWDRAPQWNMPETNPASLTSVVLAYVEWRHNRNKTN